MVTDLIYDGRGRVVEAYNRANGSQRVYTYTDGRLEQSVDADGITRSFAYDPEFGRLTSVTDHEGNTTDIAYDDQGNIADQWRNAAADPGTPTSREHWSYYHPDQPGKLYRAYTPDPNTPGQDVYAEYDYDRAGNTKTVTDPKGRATGYLYDDLNRVVEITQPGGGTTAMAYDAHGNLESVTDAEGRRTDYTYDDMGRLVVESSPDAGTTTYSYDAAGNLTASQDGRGVGTTYASDLLGRTRRIDYPAYAGQPAYSVTYDYDMGDGGKGRMTAMSDASGSTSWDYSQFDVAGMITRTSTIDALSYDVTQTLTPGGRLTQLIYPSGRSVDYARTACICAVSGVSTTFGGHTSTLLADLSYRPAGLPTVMDIGDSGTMNVDNRYDEAGRLTQANPGTVHERSYSFDANGNHVGVKLPSQPWMDQSYTYDNLGRIRSAVGSFGFVDFGYDKAGNRKTRTVNGQSESYSYVEGSNRIDRIAGGSAGTVQFGYDGHGNTVQMGSRSYSYDQENRLVHAEVDGVVAQYVYNGLGQRVVKTVDGQSTFFVYDLDGKMIAEMPGGDANLGKEHLYNGKALLAQVDVQSGAIFNYHTNYLGAVHQLTDNNGTVVWEGVYKPYGEVQVNAGSVVINNWRMPGQYFDQETGLHYNYHRYYDATIGRYLTPDPIGLEGGINLYTYTSNNPLNAIDPFGLSECQDRTLEWIEDGAKERLNLYAYEYFLKGLEAYLGDAVKDMTDAQLDALYLEAKKNYDDFALGLGIATFGMRIAAERTVRIGRWMSEGEYANLKPGARMPESRTGTTHAATNPSYFYKTAKPGSVYVEFNVPAKSVKIAPDGKVKIIGPNSLEGRNAARLGRPVPQMPKITNINKVMKK